MPNTIVLVPTYNEAENVPVLAQRLLALDLPLDVLIVDDASPDGTGARADLIAAREPRLRVLHRTGPRGYAAACREGLQLALRGGYEVICTMDADLSHDPAALPALIRAVRAGADLAIGSRYVAGGELQVDWGVLRRTVSRAGSAYARAMTGAPVHDCTSGFRAYRAAVLARVPLVHLRSDGYSFLIEVLAACARADARITEVPICYVDRRAGASKISRRIIIEAFGITSRLGLRRLFGDRSGRRSPRDE